TEAEQAPEPQALAPSLSPRPAARPQRRPEGPTEVAAAHPEQAKPETPKPETPKPETPKPAAAKPATPKPAEPADTRSGIASALSEAMAGSETRAPAAAAPAGPPLTAGEKEGLRVAVSACWNVGSLSSAALATTVVVAVSLTPDGKPQADTIRMVSSSGGDGGSAKQAFDAARRAIIRCGAKGYTLPADKYDHWRDIEMTFNPERMRIK
ncbi:MAG: energy transducer TonB, partial [Pseudodonghicola sp.]